MIKQSIFYNSKNKKKKYYAWALQEGASGISETWEDCQSQTRGFSGAKYKSFESREEAQAWLDAGASYDIKRLALDEGIYFDSGTGGDAKVKIKVIDEKNNNLIPGVKVPEGVTNNFGELLACKYALELAIEKGVKKVFGDSRLVLDYWSKNIINKSKVSPATVSLAQEVSELRKIFESQGGELKFISGGSNPADLGFHR